MRKTTAGGTAPRRPPRSRSEWRAEVERWERSGLSATAYAARHDLSRSTLFWWSNRLRATSEAARSRESVSFLPLEVRTSARPEATPFAFEVTLRSGRTLRARGDIDAARFARVLDALEGGGG